MCLMSLGDVDMYCIPFCYLPASKVQRVDPASELCLRTEFQVREVYGISQRDDFAYFVTCRDVGREFVFAPEFKCPFMCMWYDKKGQFWSGRIGMKRMLTDWHIVRADCKVTPVSLDHIVYRSRCV